MISPIIEEIVESVIIEGVPAKDRAATLPKRRWDRWFAGVMIMTIVGLALNYVWA